ncbi:MAG: MMPL family transporter [Candidatus Hydrothermarchaeota archaeon]
MMIERSLKRLARFQFERPYSVAVLALIITLIAIIGISNLRLESDISKEIPQDIDVIKLQNLIRDELAGGNIIMVLVSLDPEKTTDYTETDIRNPWLIYFLKQITDLAKKEPEVTEINSLADFFEQPLLPRELIKQVIDKNPSAKNFVNSDYTMTLIFVKTYIGANPYELAKLAEAINEDIQTSLIPPGVSISITGQPILIVKMLQLMVHDMSLITTVGLFIIFILMVIAFHSISRGLLTLIPVVMGVIWTLGILGLLNIPITTITAGMGAMIIGVGIAYGVHLMNRVMEERKRGKTLEEAIEIAVSDTGIAIISTAVTTMVGFGSLMLATMPGIQRLGFTLAMGILACLIGAICVLPSFICLEEKLMESIKDGNLLAKIRRSP